MMELETPCVVVDEEIMMNNLRRMAAIAKKHGVKLRPHTKTHKNGEIAKAQLAEGADGITVAKVSEAEVMAAQGIQDIFIAYPIIGTNKIKRMLDLNEKCRLVVGVDSLAGAQALSAAALARGQTVEVRLEVDTGLRRTGVPYDRAVALAAEMVKLPGIKLTGIFTFRGLICQGKPTADYEKAGLEEAQLMVDLSRKLQEAGMDIEDVSVGSTPTGAVAAQVPGITEIRPGTYVFYDAYQLAVGVCSPADVAARVLVTVVSTPARDLAVIDGGSKTFATDLAPGKGPVFLEGYGKVVGHEGLVLERFSEEHGILRIEPGAQELRIGDRLEIIPNHICPTINLHNKIYLRRQGKVVRELTVDGRGMVY